jgi:hypothetical protein
MSQQSQSSVAGDAGARIWSYPLSRAGGPLHAATMTAAELVFFLGAHFAHIALYEEVRKVRELTRSQSRHRPVGPS